MNVRRGWGVAFLVALLVNVLPGVALADDPVLGITTTVTPSTPALTITTTTIVPSTTTPALVITTTGPVTVPTTTAVNTSGTPVTGSAGAAGPGTSATVPITTTVAPLGITGPQPTTVLVVPATPVVPATAPTVSGSAAAPLDTTGTGAGYAGGIAAAIAALRTAGTGAALQASEPANGISAGAEASAAICLLATAIARTDLDPAALATLTDACQGTPSLANGGANASARDLASWDTDLAASFCLVAHAVALASPLSTASLAAADLDSRCGTGPTTVGLGSAVTIPFVGSIQVGGGAALCILASAIAGLPANAELATACGGTTAGTGPSLVTGGTTATVTPVGRAGLDLTAALCLVARGVGNLPASVTASSGCGSPAVLTHVPSGGDEGGDQAAPPAGTGTTGPTGPAAQAGPALVGGDSAAPRDATGARVSFPSLLPSTATATTLGAGGIGLVLLGLGEAMLRRRKTTQR